MNDPVLQLLGLSRKAGKLKIGFLQASESIKQKKAYLILVASDLSQKTEKELKFLAERENISVIRTGYDMLTISHSIGIKTGVVVVTDEGFADAILKKFTPKIHKGD